MSYLIDSNILIYASKLDDSVAFEFLSQLDTFYFASVTKIETFGYGGISENEEQQLENLFVFGTKIQLSNAIEDKAIEIRKQWSLKLGDAIITASALLGNHVLVTRNTDDFRQVDGLEIINPYVSQNDGTR